jgi:ABC-type lipoprotein release transport system permease subunit
MIATLKLSARNLLRHRRRSLLTALLITMGVVGLLLFVAAAGSFKKAMIGQITDSMLGHLQVHKKGYTAAIDNLPLNMNLQPKAVEKIEAALKADPSGSKRPGLLQAPEVQRHVQQLRGDHQRPPERDRSRGGGCHCPWVAGTLRRG